MTIHDDLLKELEDKDFVDLSYELNTVYAVKSKSEKGLVYYVFEWAEGSRSCTCRGSRFTGHCYHADEIIPVY